MSMCAKTMASQSQITSLCLKKSERRKCEEKEREKGKKGRRKKGRRERGKRREVRKRRREGGGKKEWPTRTFLPVWEPFPSYTVVSNSLHSTDFRNPRNWNTDLQVSYKIPEYVHILCTACVI